MAKHIDIYVVPYNICKNIARRSINGRVRRKVATLRSVTLYYRRQTSTTSDFLRVV